MPIDTINEFDSYSLSGVYYEKEQIQKKLSDNFINMIVDDKWIDHLLKELHLIEQIEPDHSYSWLRLIELALMLWRIKRTFWKSLEELLDVLRQWTLSPNDHVNIKKIIESSNMKNEKILIETVRIDNEFDPLRIAWITLEWDLIEFEEEHGFDLRINWIKVISDGKVNEIQNLSRIKYRAPLLSNLSEPLLDQLYKDHYRVLNSR